MARSGQSRLLNLRGRLSDLRSRLSACADDLKLRTVLRTLQLQFPALLELRRFARRTYQRARRQPFDHDFRCLAGIDFAPDEVMVDIGANRGLSIDAMRLYRPDQPTAAFEPNSSLAANLRIRFADNPKFVVHNVGLGNTAGEFTLYVPCYSGYDFDGEAAFTFDEHRLGRFREEIIAVDKTKLSYRKIRCQVWPLDQFKLKARFINIDTNGFELRVLQGAIETLQTHHPILRIANTSPSEVIELLGPMGYSEFYFDDTILPGRGVRNTIYIHLGVEQAAG